MANDIFIQSDSKIMDEFGHGIERDQRQNQPLAGLLKTVILHPQICLSFAGDSLQATKFLKQFFDADLSHWTTPRLLQDLWNVHQKSGNKCDFILCESVKRSPKITVIKDGRLDSDVEIAWIGNVDAFSSYQAAFYKTEGSKLNEKMRTAFSAVIEDGTLPDVGHFQMEAYLDHRISRHQNESFFLYRVKADWDSGSQVTHVKPNTSVVPKMGSAVHGSFGISYFRSRDFDRHGVAIHFSHGNFGILLCPKVNCEQPIVMKNCSAPQFLDQIWEQHQIGFEGFAMVSDSRLQLINNLP